MCILGCTFASKAHDDVIGGDPSCCKALAATVSVLVCQRTVQVDHVLRRG